jgi:hypothetical protein
MSGQQYTGCPLFPLTLALSLKERGYIDVIGDLIIRCKMTYLFVPSP